MVVVVLVIALIMHLLSLVVIVVMRLPTLFDTAVISVVVGVAPADVIIIVGGGTESW